MTKVYASDLTKANSSQMISALETAKSDISRLIGDINSFSSTSVTELIGSGYDAVRAKLSLYVDCFNKLSSLCDNLISCIQSANNALHNFMEGYGELDDSKIPEVEAAIAEAEAYLAWLQDTHDEPGPDENGDGIPDYTVKVRNGTDAEISACEATIRELKHYLEKLKQLVPTDRSAFGGVEAVSADIAAFAGAVSGLKIPNYYGVFPEDGGGTWAEGLAYVTPTGQKHYYSFYQYASEWQNSGWVSKEGNGMTAGCSVCSITSVLATLFQDPNITPHTVGSKWAEHNRNLQPGESKWTNFGMTWVPQVATSYGLDADLSFKGDQASLTTLLKNGGAAIVAGGQTGGAVGGHFFAIIGYDESSGKYIVADSSPAVFGGHSVDNDEHTLQSLTYEELRKRNIVNWSAIAPPGKSVEEVTRPKAVQV